MNRFILKIDSKYIDEIKKISIVEFESQYISGLIGVKTSLSLEQIRGLHFVKQADDVRKGNLYKGI